MDNNLAAVIEKRIEKTVDALNKNRFDAHYVKDKEALLDKLHALMPAGTSCSVGGSMTLFETGVIDYLKGGDFDYLDRYAQGADVEDVFRRAFCCDVYLTGANAITEEGELFNVDGNSNRVAAIAFGPKKVIVVAGYNKIVRDLDEARQRVRQIAAPANCIRLGLDTPCSKTGHCVDCRHDRHICATHMVNSFQLKAGRITVLILPEQYGY